MNQVGQVATIVGAIFQRAPVEHDPCPGGKAGAVNSSRHQARERDVSVLDDVGAPGDCGRIAVSDFRNLVDRDVQPIKLDVSAFVDRFECVQHYRIEPFRPAAGCGQGGRVEQSPDAATAPVPAPAPAQSG